RMPGSSSTINTEAVGSSVDAVMSDVPCAAGHSVPSLGQFVTFVAHLDYFHGKRRDAIRQLSLFWVVWSRQACQLQGELGTFTTRQ
ncbi:hypothetical protein, partial [Chromohalobacter japonicus]|uniref:hypothetical protein n=1 Tax=Chromohalobacter japonicus TaxID=223900 RepID=UPI003F8EFCD2